MWHWQWQRWGDEAWLSHSFLASKTSMSSQAWPFGPFALSWVIGQNERPLLCTCWLLTATAGWFGWNFGLKFSGEIQFNLSRRLSQVFLPGNQTIFNYTINPIWIFKFNRPQQAVTSDSSEVSGFSTLLLRSSLCNLPLSCTEQLSVPLGMFHEFSWNWKTTLMESLSLKWHHVNQCHFIHFTLWHVYMLPLYPALYSAYIDNRYKTFEIRVGVHCSYKLLQLQDTWLTWVSASASA